jgi:hypothetical protein
MEPSTNIVHRHCNEDKKEKKKVGNNEKHFRNSLFLQPVGNPID